MSFTIKEDSFYLNNKKVFLNSGEIHYFRISRINWEKHLLAAKEAGLTAVSSYIPWSWHESEEGVFDFNGRSCPERDLAGWINLCQEIGLHCIVKPGPVILAEYRGAGLPDWFLDQYGNECRMHNRNGDLVPGDGISLFSEKYLEKVRLWYDQIMPFISKREITAGGPIIMMQLCNEVGLFTWLAKQADYGNAVRDRFIAYLSDKFANIDEVNDLWETKYTSFDEAELPPDNKEAYSSKGDRSRDIEWHLFWRSYYGDYLKMLNKIARDKGVNIPFYHNLPGWIYGSGYEFPVNVSMYEELYDEKSDIFFGVDHIPEFMSYRNMHDDRIINDITRAMQGNKPMFAAEFQCGSREYHVVTNPIEMELFYKASLANGLTGWNYYMFSQGHNPDRKGYSGDTFYWFNPLTAEGERNSVFSLIKRMSKIIKTTEEIIVNAKRNAEICVLFYPPYYATELERPVGDECDITFLPSAIRRPAFYDGLLKVLQILNVDYDMADLSKVPADVLNKYKQVWMFSTDEMNAPDQQKIIAYTNSGGQVILFPFLPDRELSQKPCSIIRKSLSVFPSGSESTESPLIDLYDQKDIKCANPQVTYSEDSLVDSEIIARTLSGKACGFSKKLGEGSIIHLGTWIGFDTESHIPVYKAFLNKSGAKLSHVSSDNINITVRERFTEDQSALLFAGNYYNENQSGKISYTHPKSFESIQIPYSGDQIIWPGLYAMITPVCMNVEEGIQILHTTSDILNIEKSNSHLKITLQGHRDFPGELVLEGSGIQKLRTATISGRRVKMTTDQARVIVSYRHKHDKYMVLNIEISQD